MVTLTLELSEQRAAILRARAEAVGVSVSELVAQSMDLDVDQAHYDLTPEQEEQIIRAAEEADAGDVISEEDAMTALRALDR